MKRIKIQAYFKDLRNEISLQRNNTNKVKTPMTVALTTLESPPQRQAYRITIKIIIPFLT